MKKAIFMIGISNTLYHDVYYYDALCYTDYTYKFVYCIVSYSLKKALNFITMLLSDEKPSQERIMSTLIDSIQ